ncbi:hypothetical protein STEG23_022286 [Scotinomys teguina]
MAWHGETYCLVGGYRLYGDAPLATPAKPEEEKPAPRRALKRKTFAEEPDQHLGCPLAKISRLTIIRDDKWAQDLGDPSTLLASQAKAEAPRRARKRKTVHEDSEQDLGCPRAKIPRLKIKHARKRVSWITLQRRRLRAKRPRLTINHGGKRDHCLGCPCVPLATYAKAEEKKPAPRRALKRKTVHEDSEQDLGCPRAKIPRLNIERARKRVSWFTLQRRRLRAKIPRQTIKHGGKRDHCLGCPCVPLATYAKAEEKKPAPRRALKRKREQEKSKIDLGCPRAKIPRLKIKHARKRVSWFTLQRRRLRSGW